LALFRETRSRLALATLIRTPRPQPGAEREMLGVERDVEGEPLASRPTVLFPLDDRRIGVAVVGGEVSALEGRSGAKSNAVWSSTYQTQSWESVSPALDLIRATARRDKRVRFTPLLHHVTTLLRWSFLRLLG
jgi:hypothetical protein